MIGRITALSLLMLALAKPVFGAEFSFWPCEGLPCSKASTILMAGPIVKGDYQRLYDILRERGPTISTLNIISVGGSVSEAIEIGNMVRRLRLSTGTGSRITPQEAGDGETANYLNGVLISKHGTNYLCPAGAMNNYRLSECVCLSACFLVYAAGIGRSGNVIGLHRPTFVDAGFGNLDASTADRRYQELMKRVQSYLSSMGVNDAYFQKMMRVSSTEMYIVPASEANDNLAGVLPSFAEWLKSRCGELSSKEADALIDMRVRVSAGLRARDREYDELEKKDKDIGSCRRSTMLSEREMQFKDFFSGKRSSSFWPF